MQLLFLKKLKKHLGAFQRALIDKVVCCFRAGYRAWGWGISERKINITPAPQTGVRKNDLPDLRRSLSRPRCGAGTTCCKVCLFNSGFENPLIEPKDVRFLSDAAFRIRNRRCCRFRSGQLVFFSSQISFNISFQ